MSDNIGLTGIAALEAEMRDRLAAKDAEIMRLRERLEMDFAWQLVDGKMTRVEVEPGSIPDGIDCRDETIRQQDRLIAELRAQVRGGA